MVRRTIPLDGAWQHRPDPLQVGELYPAELAYTHADDARWMRASVGSPGWTPTTVPGPWPLERGDATATVWFRRAFAAPEAADGRVLLQLDGVNYLSDVWLNGRFLATHEGYFAPQQVDVTEVLQPENTLVVRVTKATDVLGRGDQMGQLKRDLVGALGRWDMNDPEWMPAGIWGSVRLVVVAEAHLDACTIDSRLLDLPEPGGDEPVRAVASIGVDLLDHAPSGTATVRWSLAPVGFDGPEQSGSTEVVRLGGRRRVAIDAELVVRPWWTWDLGVPRLYDLTVELWAEGRLLDEQVERTGFRDLTCDAGWDLRLNGVRLYQRGANSLSDLDLSSMTRERSARDVALFREANLNTVHPFCLVEAPGLYLECDAQGLIVYQDLPFWLMVDPSSATVRRALAQLDEMIALLRNRPSVAVWNLGSQASVANVEKLCAAFVARARELDPGRIANHSNAAVSYEATDDVHPVRSFFWSRDDADRFARELGWRRDDHLYPGWYFGGLDAIADIPHEDLALVTEFGGQALPDRAVLEEFLDTSAGIDWVGIARHGGQPALLQRHNPDAATLDELIASSQRHQAELVRHHTEHLRTRKGDPGRGLHLFAFTDCWPAVSWSVLDHRRNPKRAFGALREAMAPVQAFLRDHLDERDGGRAELAIAIVNDGPRPITDATVRLLVDGRAAGTAEALSELPTDRAIDVVLPGDLPAGGGRVRLAIELRWTGGTRTNEYDLRVRATRS